MIEFFKRLGVGLAIIVGGISFAVSLVALIEYNSQIAVVIYILAFSWFIGYIIRDKPSS